MRSMPRSSSPPSVPGRAEAVASIRKRPGRPKNDPRYDVRYRDPSGRVRTSTFRRKVDAETFADQIETNIDRGEWVDPELGDVTLGAYPARWLAAKPSLRALTR